MSLARDNTSSSLEESFTNKQVRREKGEMKVKQKKGGGREIFSPLADLAINM